jgi:hypothetical protein
MTDTTPAAGQGDPQTEERDYQQQEGTPPRDEYGSDVEQQPRLSSDPDPDPDADVEPDAPNGLGEPAEHPDPPPQT